MRTETSFDEIDNETARSQYNSWAARKSETLDEFMMRKRKIELNNLVRMVIDKELTEQEKEIVGLHWYGGKSAIETAEALGMSKSLISKKISKINDKIYDKLKYALEFRFGSDFLGECRVIIKSKAECPVAAGPASTARRIKQPTQSKQSKKPSKTATMKKRTSCSKNPTPTKRKRCWKNSCSCRR